MNTYQKDLFEDIKTEADLYTGFDMSITEFNYYFRVDKEDSQTIRDALEAEGYVTRKGVNYKWR